MFKYLMISFTVLLTGCGTLSNVYMAMPTVEYCEQVSYTRINNDISVEMKCVKNEQ